MCICTHYVCVYVSVCATADVCTRARCGVLFYNSSLSCTLEYIYLGIHFLLKSLIRAPVYPLTHTSSYCLTKQAFLQRRVMHLVNNALPIPYCALARVIENWALSLVSALNSCSRLSHSVYAALMCP